LTVQAGARLAGGPAAEVIRWRRLLDIKGLMSEQLDWTPRGLKVENQLNAFGQCQFYPPKIQNKAKPHTAAINTNQRTIDPQFRMCP
jgi:hypothetical protein